MTNHPNAPTERIEIVHPRRPFEEWIVDSPLPDTAQVVPNDVLLDPDSEEELRVGYSYTTRGDVETVGDLKNALEEGSMGSVDIDLEGYQCITRLRHTIRLVANRTDDDTEIVLQWPNGVCDEEFSRRELRGLDTALAFVLAFHDLQEEGTNILSVRDTSQWDSGTAPGVHRFLLMGADLTGAVRVPQHYADAPAAVKLDNLEVTTFRELLNRLAQEDVPVNDATIHLSQFTNLGDLWATFRALAADNVICTAHTRVSLEWPGCTSSVGTSDLLELANGFRFVQEFARVQEEGVDVLL